jgi:uncharacterized protein
MDWRNSVIAYIREEAKPQDKFGHQPRLYRLTQELAADPSTGLKCDDDVLFAAAWMHDLGVFLGHRPSDPVELAQWNHVPYTIARTLELLPKWGFPQSKLNAVAETIRTHEAKYEPVIPEAVVLRDADILEQLGAVGALRAIVKVGRDTRYATYSEIVPVLEKALAHLPGQLRLAQSRTMAESRVEILSAFLKAIRNEAGLMLH